MFLKKESMEKLKAVYHNGTKMWDICNDDLPQDSFSVIEDPKEELVKKMVFAYNNFDFMVEFLDHLSGCVEQEFNDKDAAFLEECKKYLNN